MSKKYIKCDCCGEKIFFGDRIYYMNGYCGTYCSADCFVCMYGEYDELTEEHAENCMCEIYDDDIIEKKKAELRANMNKCSVN